MTPKELTPEERERLNYHMMVAYGQTAVHGSGEINSCSDADAAFQRLAGIFAEVYGLVPRAELDALRERIHALLTEIEWANWAGHSGGCPSCPCCDAGPLEKPPYGGQYDYQNSKHEADCKLAALLAESHPKEAEETT